MVHQLTGLSHNKQTNRKNGKNKLKLNVKECARGGEMKLHEAMRLSPDCSGERFKASGVSRTAPSGAYLK